MNWTAEASARNSRCRLIGALDQVAEEHAEVAEDHQRQAEQEDAGRRRRSCSELREDVPANRMM